MAAVANVRVNAQAPFPALVMGSGPVTLGKANGVFTIGLTPLNLQQVGLLPVNFQTEFVLMFDQGSGQWFRVTLAALGVGGVRVQRSVTASPIVIALGDQLLNVNINAGLPTCTLPQTQTRNGAPLTFKDIGGQFGAHPLTITPFAGDTIDGAASLVLNVPRQGVTLVPVNDGVNTATWSIV